jgi:hypothetical protein
MTPEVFSSLSSVIALLGGFLDFVIFVGTMFLALTSIRRIYPGLGMGIAGLAVSRFLCFLLSRTLAAVFKPIPFNDMDGVVPIVLILLQVVSTFLTASLWAALLFALYRMAARART